jgi:hypothetical protein
MTDYLITNSAAILGGVEDASVPGSFNPLYAGHAVRFDASEPAGVALPPVNDLWLRADCCYDGFDLSTEGDGMMWTVGILSTDIARVDLVNGEKYLACITGTSWSGLTSGPVVSAIPNGMLFTLDVQIETGAAIDGNEDAYRVAFYINDGLLASVQSTCTHVNGGPPVRFAFGGFDYLVGNGRFFLSNVLISDQDTRGRRFTILRPSGPGAQGTAVGGYAELGDGSPATFAYANAASDAVTSTITPGAAPPGTIGKVVLFSYARNAADDPNPSQVINRQRLGGVKYDAAAQAPAGASIKPLASSWMLNPATGEPWSWADLIDLEIGFAGGA